MTGVFSAVSATAGTVSAFYTYKTSKATVPIIVSPDLVEYADIVQARASKELDSLAPPCPANLLIADCSAVSRMILDYSRMREQVRAIRETD